MTWSEKLDKLLVFLGALVPLMSAVASYLNHRVRSAQADGKRVSAAVLHVGALLNVGALNLDKAVQLVKTAKQDAEGEK
jgi:hypothetical protein